MRSSFIQQRLALPPHIIRWALTLVGLFASAALAVPGPLTDQYDKEGGMDKFSGQPVVVFVTSLRELPDLGAWEEAIRPSVPAFNSLDIGDINTSSGLVQKTVVAELKKHVPDGVSVYIDPENTWAKEYDLDLGEPCVLIFDANHELIETFRGKPKGELLENVISQIRKVFPPAAT